MNPPVIASIQLKRLAAVCLAVLLLGSCRIIPKPQVPGDDEAFELVRLGSSYAVTIDASGEPIGVWDLGYPVARREGDAERDRFPVRLVHLRNPDEPGEIDSSERWRFGYRSFIAGFVSFNILKWYQTMDLFDVREVRKARTAMLHGWLLGSGTDAWTVAGLGEARRQQVMDQLGVGPTDSPTDCDLAEVFAEDLIEQELSAAETEILWLDSGQAVGLADGMPLVVYSSDCDHAVWLPLETPEEEVSDALSLGLNTVGTMALVGAGAAVGFPIGTPFSIYSSIYAIVPFRREDKDYATRGRLLGYLTAKGSALPEELESYRDRWIEELRRQLKEGNRYWPATPDEFHEGSWRWLDSQAQAAAL